MTQPIATRRPATAGSKQKLILATNNRGKINELREILGGAWQVLGMDDLGVSAAEETGTTFEENAILKAEAVAAQTGVASLADDSGLVVASLGGAPGVYSARYAGPEADDAANRKLLLRNMELIESGNRHCHFVCVIALAIPGEETTIVRGQFEGSVGLQENGSNGFGYDSLFLVPDGRSLAQLDSCEKNAISHRAVAMKRMISVLRERLTGGASTC